MAEIQAPPADTGEETLPDAALEEVNSFFGEGKEGEEPAAPESLEEAPTEEPEAEEDAEFNAAVEAAAEARAEKVRREEAQKRAEAQADQQAQAEQQRQQREFAQRYRGRIESVRKDVHDLAVEAGMDEAEATRRADAAANNFNSHHADGLQIYGAEARQQAALRYATDFNTAVRQELGDMAEAFFGTETEPKSYRTQQEAFRALREAFTTGMLTEAEAKAQAKQAVLEFRRRQEESGGARANRSSQPVSGRATRGLSFDQEEAMLADPSTDIKTIEEILNRRAKAEAS